MNVRSTSARHRKHVTRACEQCRIRRSKCDSQRPCQPCRAHRVMCTDASLDRRTLKVDLPSQTSLPEKAILNSLLRAIRHGNAEKVARLVEDGASLEQITKSLEAENERLARDDYNRDNLTETLTTSEEEIVSPVVAGSAEGPRHASNMPMSSSIRTKGLSSRIQIQQLENSRPPVWERLPLVNHDASSHDVWSTTIFSFRTLAREQIVAGASPELVLSSGGLETDLLFRDRLPEDPHTLSTWACEVIKTFTFLPLVTKLAMAESLAISMRWLILPSKEHYMALPPDARPLEMQLFVPHSIGLDVINFAELRRSLLERGSTDDWINNLTPTTMSFNWPYSESACFESVPATGHGEDQSSPRKRLSKAFIEHVHNMGNLSLDKDILKALPELAGKFHFHERDSLESFHESATSNWTHETC